MLKIGLAACHQSSAPYKVLYTAAELTQHHRQKGMLPISYELFYFIHHLTYNERLEKAINDFRKQFGTVSNDEKKQLDLVSACRALQETRPYLHTTSTGNKYMKLIKYTSACNSIKIHDKQPTSNTNFDYDKLIEMATYLKSHYYGKGHPTRKRIKEIGGYYMLPLFYGGIVDTGYGVNKSWDSNGIGIVKSHHGLTPILNISLRYQDITKNKLLTFVEQHWKQIHTELKALNRAGKYYSRVQYLKVLQLKQEGKSWKEIADRMTNDSDCRKPYSSDKVRKEYKETKKFIDTLF